MKKSLTLMIILLSLCSTVSSKKEETNVAGEILTDLAVGSFFAACEGNSECSSFMTLVGVTVGIGIISVCLCGDDDDRRSLWSSMPSGRRMATTGAGYYATRRAFRR